MAIGARLPLSLRFVVPLALALAAIAYAVVPLVDRLTFQWFVRDLDMRGSLILQTAQDPLVELLRSGRGARERVLRYFDRIAEGQRVFALGFCEPGGKVAYATRVFPEAVRCGRVDRREPRTFVLELTDGALHVSAQPVVADGQILGELMIVHDMSFAQRRSEDTRKYVLWLFAGIAAVVALITVVIAEISWRGWMAGIKAVISGDYLLRSPTAAAAKVSVPELRPFARDLQALVNDLENERRARDESQTSWG